MSVKEFRIILDSPVYYTGQKITGRVLVQLTKLKRIKGIRVIYSGSGLVKWSHGHGTRKVHFMEAQEFLDLEQRVFGNGEDECELTAGQHVFPFYCKLPSDLACSYKGKFGRIKYTVKAKIDDQSFGSKYSVKQLITILSVFDLNCLPIAAIPVSEKTTKTFGRRSGPLHMSFDLPVRGFVPGQIIPIKVSLNNESKVRVKSVIATLSQNVIFRADMAVNHSRVPFTAVQLPILGGFGLKEAFLHIQVPALPPSYLEFCKIIDFRYHLTVEAQTDNSSKNPKIHTEILIGNIPLMSYQKPIAGRQPFSEIFNPKNLVCSQRSSDQLHRPPSVVSFPHLATYGNYLPPTYEQTEFWTEPTPDLTYPVYKFVNIEACN